MELSNVGTRALNMLASHRRWARGAMQVAGSNRNCLGSCLNKAELAEMGIRAEEPDQTIWNALRSTRAAAEIIKANWPDRVWYPASASCPVHQTHGCPCQIVPTFNDHEFTTYADVRVVLEKLAAS